MSSQRDDLEVAPDSLPAAGAASRRAHHRVLTRLVVLAVFVVVAIIVAIVVPVPGPEQIRAIADSAGTAGGVAFLLGYAVLTLTPLPKNVLGMAAGLTWGFAGGSLLVYAGSLLGATLAFVIGRSLGRDAVERFTGARVARVDELLRRHGLATVIGARLIPVLPFTAINYAAGLTAVRRGDYALGTAIGIIPGTLAYVALGAVGLELGWPFWIAVGVLGGLTVLGLFLARRARRTTHSR
ncbi:TVP38/TMEM64 family protein [Cryobacterium cryoconiti]|uniref:TVP38/TMEM64 family membrane protein n=1 Tax=Cryobacterium cryoconiti TaxID=1259239 RepID=A0A4Y8K032_9MICO|nr:TVP38/TMEM64 family protein [Cryobacterium cryoconiti]TFD34209.1 TVP38/TMEM64 family protein [Cryobacterium cryoconiti]